MKTIRCRRDGSFIRLDLPRPGKWVIAMRPSTANQLADLLKRPTGGHHEIGGIGVHIELCSPHRPFDPLLLLGFAKWPSKCTLNKAEIEELVREIRSNVYVARPSASPGAYQPV